MIPRNIRRQLLKYLWISHARNPNLFLVSFDYSPNSVSRFVMRTFDLFIKYGTSENRTQTISINFFYSYSRRSFFVHVVSMFSCSSLGGCKACDWRKDTLNNGAKSRNVLNLIPYLISRLIRLNVWQVNDNGSHN